VLIEAVGHRPAGVTAAQDRPDSFPAIPGAGLSSRAYGFAQ